MKALCLFLVFIWGMPGLADELADLYFKVPDKSAYCISKEKDIEGFFNYVKTSNDNRSLPEDKINWAEDSLKNIAYPTDREADAAVAAIKQDTEKEFKNSKALTNDCAVARLKISRALINMARQTKSIEKKQKAHDIVLNALRKTKFPALLSIQIDIAIIRHANQTKLLEISKSTMSKIDKISSALKKLQTDVLHQLKDFGTRFKADQDWKKIPDYPKVAAILTKEMSETRKLSSTLQVLLNKNVK